MFLYTMYPPAQAKFSNIIRAQMMAQGRVQLQQPQETLDLHNLDLLHCSLCELPACVESRAMNNRTVCNIVSNRLANVAAGNQYGTE